MIDLRLGRRVDPHGRANHGPTVIKLGSIIALDGLGFTANGTIVTFDCTRS